MSGDARPYAVEREIEDLAAVIEAVGAPIRTLSVLEAPYRGGEHRKPPSDYVEHLKGLYDADDGDAMMQFFLTAGVGQPQESVDAMRQQPFWAGLAAVGVTTYYDALCLGGSQAPLPTELLARVNLPVLSVASTGSPPFLVEAARAAAAAVPEGRFVQLTGEFHGVTTAVLATELVAHPQPR